MRSDLRLLNLALAQFAEVPRIDWPGDLFGMLTLWVVGLLAALVPALARPGVRRTVATVVADPLGLTRSECGHG